MSCILGVLGFPFFLSPLGMTHAILFFRGCGENLPTFSFYALCGFLVEKGKNLCFLWRSFDAETICFLGKFSLRFLDFSRGGSPHG